MDGGQGIPSPLNAKDDGRNAVPFNRDLLAEMTPTMRSFTLDGKVAVVTGYVSGRRVFPSFMSFFFVLFNV